MRKKIYLSQLKKYDVNQKILEALADAQSRSILFSIVKDGKTALDLSEKYKIPLSSVYKKISDLEDIALIRVEKCILSDNGKKFKVYKSRISRAEISIKKPEPSITLSPNESWFQLDVLMAWWKIAMWIFPACILAQLFCRVGNRYQRYLKN